MKFVPHLNGKTWKSVVEAQWWPNQQKAVELAGDYLDAKSDQQAMIRMPTGTGKTVVIATLAQLLEDCGSLDQFAAPSCGHLEMHQKWLSGERQDRLRPLRCWLAMAFID